MNKKEARKRKKLVNQVRHHRVLPSGRVLTADGRETLLGNLAPVKHIPALPWKRVMAFPTCISRISVATEGENAWFYRFLVKMSQQAHDLIGFTPVDSLESDSFEQMGVGSVGIAVQVKRVEPAENGRVNVFLKGICRYENTGFLHSTEDAFCINVRWFEDNREADALVKPEFENCLRTFDQITHILDSAGLRESTEEPKNLPYNFTAAQYLSFSLVEAAQDHFKEAEKLEFLLMRSTSERFRKLNEYSAELLAETERRFKDRMKS